MQQHNQNVYTVEQVATILQVKRYAILNKIKNKELKALKFGRKYRISEHHLQEFLKSNN